MKAAFAVCVTTLAIIATSVAAEVPQGWMLAGDRGQDYDVSSDNEQPEHPTSALLQSLPDRTPDGFGTLMQAFRAARYAGKRVRMTADVRAQGVNQWAGLWMRADAPRRQSAAFDNMQNRPITGTSDWRAYEIVLDIPADSDSISFGVLLVGRGQVWIDNVRFETVDTSVRTTGRSFLAGSSVRAPRRSPPAQSEGPANLDFESH